MPQHVPDEPPEKEGAGRQRVTAQMVHADHDKRPVAASGPPGWPVPGLPARRGSPRRGAPAPVLASGSAAVWVLPGGSARDLGSAAASASARCAASGPARLARTPEILGLPHPTTASGRAAGKHRLRSAALQPPLPGESPGGRRPAGEPTGRWRQLPASLSSRYTALREDTAPCPPGQVAQDHQGMAVPAAIAELAHERRGFPERVGDHPAPARYPLAHSPRGTTPGRVREPRARARSSPRRQRVRAGRRAAPARRQATASDTSRTRHGTARRSARPGAGHRHPRCRHGRVSHAQVTRSWSVSVLTSFVATPSAS